MQKILFVAHCVINTCAKVVSFNQTEIQEEEALRRRFLHAAVDAGVQLVQLPCPEFTLYGACRWGHVSNQFDNPFFRQHCRTLLEPAIEQLKEYAAHHERFEILGFLGIDGSPSCGVDYTCYGDGWLGSFEGRGNLTETLATCHLDKGRGIFIDELHKLLLAEGLGDSAVLTGLFAPEPEKCLNILNSTGI